jgi:exonuclease SbcD
MGIKLMHFADTHFGVENYGRTDPVTGLNTRFLDFVRATNFAIEFSLKHEADLIVFAGDAYKTRVPDPTHQREFARCIRKLTDKGIPVFLLVGNHDLPGSTGRADTISIFDTLLGVDRNIYVLDKPGLLEVETKHGKIQIGALPYLSKDLLFLGKAYEDNTQEAIRDNLIKKYLDIIHSLSVSLNPALPSVLIAHSSVSGASLSSEQDIMIVDEVVLPLEALISSGFDYVALGHIHRFQNLNKNPHPPIIYSGSIERIDFSEEKERKGFVWVDVERGRTSYEFIEVPTRKFFSIELHPSQSPSEALKGDELRDAIVKVVIKGREEEMHGFSERGVRDVLREAHIATIKKDVIVGERRVRAEQINECLNPIEALDEYLRFDKRWEKDRDELRRYTARLIEELREEGKL